MKLSKKQRIEMKLFDLKLWKNYCIERMHYHKWALSQFKPGFLAAFCCAIPSLLVTIFHLVIFYKSDNPKIAMLLISIGFSVFFLFIVQLYLEVFGTEKESDIKIEMGEPIGFPKKEAH